MKSHISNTTRDAACALLDRVHRRERAIARLRAGQYADLDRLCALVGDDGAEGELAPALTITHAAAGAWISRTAIVTSVPAMFALLKTGAVDEWRVRVVHDELTQVLTPGDPRWAAVDQAAARVAAGMNSGRLRRYVHALLISIDPDAAERDRLKALKERRVVKYVSANGMSTILADLTGEDAALVMATLHAIADLAPKDDPRTRPQLLADAFAGLFRAVAEGRPLDLIPAPTPPVDPAEPDYARIPEQWIEPDHDQPDHAHDGQDVGQDGVDGDGVDGDGVDGDGVDGDGVDGDGVDGDGVDGDGVDGDAHDCDRSDVRRAAAEEPRSSSRDDAPAHASGPAHGPEADRSTVCACGGLPTDGLESTGQAPADLPRYVPDLWQPPKLGTRQGERLRLVLHMDYDTFITTDNLPAFLAGHGHLTPQAARDLARQCDSVDLVIRNRPPGNDPGPDPRPDPGPGPGPGTDPGPDPGPDPGTDPGPDPGTDPGPDPGTDVGLEPGTSSARGPESGCGSEHDSGPESNRGSPPGSGTGDGTRNRSGGHACPDPAGDGDPPADDGADPCTGCGPGHVHHPHAGEYRPRQNLVRLVTARHQCCRAPGCSRPARQCQLDHVIPWPDGPSCECNLLPLCAFHHNLKTHGGFGYVLHPDGSITWTTALGRSYHQPPPDDLSRP